MTFLFNVTIKLVIVVCTPIVVATGLIEKFIGLAMKPVLMTLLLILFAINSCLVFADPVPRLVQLEAAVNQVQQEQQSLYQQFLMTQELRRNALQDIAPTITQGYSVKGTGSANSLDYDENVRLQRERLERLQRYDRDLEQAYSRFLELGNQKKALLDQMMELTHPAKP